MHLLRKIDMTVQLVVFSHAADERLLRLNLQYLVRSATLHPDISLRVHVADDAASPAFDDEAAAFAAGAGSYERTTFARGERLNGLECLDGMLVVYRRLFDAAQATDWICQLDCDTLVEHFGWLTQCPPHVALTGCRFSEPALDFAYGPTMALRPAALEAIDRAMAMPGVRARLASCDCFTDRCMTLLAKIGGASVHLWDARRQRGSLKNGFRLMPSPRENDATYSHVIFEKRLLACSLSREEKIARCVQNMKDYIGSLEIGR